MSDETLPTNFSTTRTFEFTALNSEALNALLGGARDEEPTHAVTFDYETEWSGPQAPTPPARRKGLWAWLTMANQKAEAKHQVAYATYLHARLDWIEAGRPGLQNRIHIPHAHISEVTDDSM